ncbi:MAG: hypothetical protein IPH18_03610 [Chitinophagaceae bacterium]|nr:hypothetical protein [Chitinophagaceae bacterium]
MIKYVIILFLFLPAALLAQESPAELSKKLVANCKTDKEKVRVLFRWVTDNISYRTRHKKPAGNSTLRSSKPVLDEIKPADINDIAPLKPLNERVAEDVLRSRLAVCDGYTRLFKTLCDYAGLRCEIILGYARTDNNKPNVRFGVNHYWNAVWFDSSWHLMDVTWASGYITRTGDEFVSEYDSRYFMATPEQCIKDHFPDDPRWSLLQDNYVPDEFRHSPYKQKSFAKYSITSLWPVKGIIEASTGDTVRLHLIRLDEGDRRIAPDLLADTTLYSHTSAAVF